MCSRCLTYGIDCVYSPSSRSGRARTTSNVGQASHVQTTVSASCPRDQSYDEAQQNPRPTFLEIPPSTFSDSESSYDSTSSTPGLGQSFGQWSSHGQDGLMDTSATWVQHNKPPAAECTFAEYDFISSASEFSIDSPYWNSELGHPGFATYYDQTLQAFPPYDPMDITGDALMGCCQCQPRFEDSNIFHHNACPLFSIYQQGNDRISNQKSR